jgi:hypothetical protein
MIQLERKRGFSYCGVSFTYFHLTRRVISIHYNLVFCVEDSSPSFIIINTKQKYFFSVVLFEFHFCSYLLCLLQFLDSHILHCKGGYVLALKS